MSRSRWRVQRLPPGSLLSCASMRPAHHRDEAVDVALTLDARGAQEIDRAGEHRLGERVRLGRRLEARDRPLEQQRAAGRVLDREVPTNARMNAFTAARGFRQLQRVEPLEELAVAVGEHRVVERVLRVEVGVERRLADADLASQRVEREPADAVARASSQAVATIDATFASRRCATLPIIDRQFTY